MLTKPVKIGIGLSMMESGLAVTVGFTLGMGFWRALTATEVSTPSAGQSGSGGDNRFQRAPSSIRQSQRRVAD